ncbi:MAG TPA: ABC transporter ATP-binding protein [Acidothermaceae bacterium]
MPVIETAALTKRYGPVTALDALTVAIEPGIVGLVGANGAGKSTLIKVLLGLLEPTAGAAQVLGRDIVTEGEQVRGLVGYMPEHDCLPPDVSATELVGHLGRVAGLPRAAARERTAEVLRHVGLYEERYRPIGGYSTGMKQRVKLAQALVHDPQLLLLDEPTNGLDPAGRDEMLALVQRTGTEFGMAVVVASHLLGELERICEHLVVIDAGKLRASDSIASYTRAQQLLAVEVDGGAPARDALAARLTEININADVDGRALVVALPPDDEAAMYDAVRDTVADLGLALLRLEQRRHRLSDMFSEPHQAHEDLPRQGQQQGEAAGV